MPRKFVSFFTEWATDSTPSFATLGGPLTWATCKLKAARPIAWSPSRQAPSRIPSTLCKKRDRLVPILIRALWPINSINTRLGHGLIIKWSMYIMVCMAEGNEIEQRKSLLICPTALATMTTPTNDQTSKLANQHHRHIYLCTTREGAQREGDTTCRP